MKGREHDFSLRPNPAKSSWGGQEIMCLEVIKTQGIAKILSHTTPVVPKKV